MKKVIVKNLEGVQTHGAQMEDPAAWILDCVEHDYWGKKERLVPQDEPHEASDVLEEVDVVMSPEIPAVMNDAGEIVQEAIPAVVKKHVKLRAQYTVEIVDVTAEWELDECIQSRKDEYPSPEEFMNAYFDGGPAALGVLMQQRLEVKAKYPKPGV
jgi:hypothetical protein